jgi:hypothetical protein
LGGSGGGGGIGGVFAYGGAGGSGGGSVRVMAALSIDIGNGTAYGGIDASGCGGGPGLQVDGASAAGGGGSGGAILVEAPRVALHGFASLLAAGGGGGNFGGTQGGSASIGDTEPALGCPSPGTWPDPGTAGAGAWLTANGADGNALPYGCAGGGGAGWITVLATDRNVAQAQSVILAPAPPWYATGALAPP